jgi:hypothetical protein
MSMKKPDKLLSRSLQHKIILHLAQTGPQTINATNKGVNGHYKATWQAFKSLENQKLIEKQDYKSYNNREYPLFWLTSNGVFAALKSGAKAASLKANMERALGKHESISLFFDLVDRMEPKHIDDLSRMWEASDNDGFRLVSLPTIEAKKAADIFRVVKNHPHYVKKVKESLDQIRRLIE